MEGVRRPLIIASLVLLVSAAVVSVVLLASSGKDSTSSTSTTSTPSGSTVAPGSTSPSDVATTSVPAGPPSTAKPGEVAPMGTAIVVQELPDECSKAVAPLRQLMKDYENGYRLDEAGAEILNEAAGKARQACSAEDWERFNIEEFRGWLEPAPVKP